MYVRSKSTPFRNYGVFPYRNRFACVLARTLAWLEEILVFTVWFQ